MPTTIEIEAVLDAMQDGQGHRPTELIESLKGRGVTEATAKLAISYLINNCQVEMTENRSLRIADLVA
jgi:hypothetical protein